MRGIEPSSRAERQIFHCPGHRSEGVHTDGQQEKHQVKVGIRGFMVRRLRLNSVQIDIKFRNI